MRHLWFVFIGLISLVTTNIQAVSSNNIEIGSYNQDDQLIKIVKPDGTTIEYTYDDNGNLIQKKTSEGMWNFTYNEEDQLVRVDHHHSGWQGKPPFEVVIVYAYDPTGRRVFKEVDGARTYYFHTDEGLAEEYDNTGKVIRQYGHAPDSSLPRWVKTDTGTSFYYYDRLGTPQKLVDQNGIVVWEATYDDFGKAQITTEVVENNLRFPGQYYDAETGLHYNWHRYYDPETGRYLTRDPISSDTNDYSYTGNNPVNAIDPIGLAYTHLTPEETARIIELHNQGVSYGEIASQLGRSNSAVRRFLVINNLLIVKHPSMDPDMRRVALELRAGGANRDAIAQRIGSNPVTVDELLGAEGYGRLKSGPKPFTFSDDVKRMIIESAGNGMFAPEISKLPGVNASAGIVRDFLRAMGVYSPSPRRQPANEEEIAEFVRLHVEENMVPNQIETQTGRSNTYIRKILKERGVYRPRAVGRGGGSGRTLGGFAGLLFLFYNPLELFEPGHAFGVCGPLDPLRDDERCDPYTSIMLRNGNYD